MTPHSDSPPCALVLDFGGVVTKTLFETHRATEAALGLQSGTLDWQGPFEPASDPLWRSMQAGEISERDYWHTRASEVGALVGQSWDHMSDFVRAARGAEPQAVIRPEALDAMDRVKAAGLQLAILSNELDLFYGEGFRVRLPWFTKVDVVVDATHTGILKPDPRSYADCIGQLDLHASQCVFVDDQARNIDGAMRAGMQTVLFDVKMPGQSYAAALSLLGL
jgi:putative hydrolase of the HAD superfamily